MTQEVAEFLFLTALHTSDGADFARLLPSSVDFVLVDYSIPAFSPAFEILREKLQPGAFLFADGWAKSGCWETEEAWRDFKEGLENDAGFLCSTFTFGKVHLIAVRI